jgi:arabinofuranosyltransferase
MQNNKQAVICLVALLLVFGYCAESYYLFTVNDHPCEDAYITYRFAKNLAEGNGAVFNAGERVEGYSNFLWMVLISGAYRLGFDMPAFSRFVCWLSNTLTFFLLWLIPIRYFSQRGLSILVAPALYVLFLPLQYIATSGLETAFYTALIVLCALAVLWARSRALPFAAASLLLLLVALTRPEGILFSVYFAAYLGLCRLTKKEPLRPYIPGLIIIIAGYSLFLLGRFSYYHALVPNTYYAKGTFPLLIRMGLGMFTARSFVTRYPYFAILLLMLWKARGLSVERRLLAPFFCFIAAGLTFSIFLSGFDWVPFFRYTLPVVPLLMILCGIIVARLWNSALSHAPRARRIIWGGITAACFIIAAEQFYADLMLTFRLRDIDAFVFYNQKVFGEWMKKEIGATGTVCIGDVGRIAYLSEVKILDIVGLASRDFALLRKKYVAPELEFPFCSINFNVCKEQERALLLKLQPDYVMLYNARLKMAPTYFGSAAGITEHDDFRQRYEYVARFDIVPKTSSLSWPRSCYFNSMFDLSSGLLAWIYDGWGYDIYVRRDSPCKRFTIEFYPDDRIKNIIVKQPARK